MAATTSKDDVLKLMKKRDAIEAEIKASLEYLQNVSARLLAIVTEHAVCSQCVSLHSKVSVWTLL